MQLASGHPRDGGIILVAFTCGWMTLPSSFFLDGESGKMTVPATVFLLDHPKGLALFDTGLGPRFERPAGTPKTGAVDLEDNANIAARLTAIGIDPAAIRWVINSHLHADHAGGNVYLPNATIVVQEREWEFAFEGIDRAYTHSEFDLGQPLWKVRGEHDLFGDGSCVLFPTTGHTAGHQSARVQTVFGEIVLAADCCNLRRSLEEMRLPDHCFDAAQYMATLQMLKAMQGRGTRIVYGHDPVVWAAIPQNVPLASLEAAA